MSKEAKRDNQGKEPLALIPGSLLRAGARAFAYGATKYGQNNWLLGGPQMSYISICNSLLRHIVALKDGEDRDPESGLLHSDHITANVTMLTEFIESGRIVDDRYKGDQVGQDRTRDED